MRTPLLLLFAVSQLACGEPAVRVPEADLAIANVTVIDGHGGPPLADRTVLIDGDRIAAIGIADRTELPEGAAVIDGEGRFLIPGLWDMHVHAWSPRPFSEIFLRHGITAVREMGTGIDPLWGGSAGVWDWRAAVQAGELAGPRVFAAGFILNGGLPEQQGAPFFKGVPDAAAGRQWVDTLAERGADFVKVYSALSPDAFLAIAERARERDLTIVGHVPGRVGTREAVRQGLASLEHMYDVLIATSTDQEAVRREVEQAVLESTVPTVAAQSAERERVDRLIKTFDPDRAAALYELFREHDTWISPTLAVIGDPRCPDWPLPTPDADPLADVPAFLRRFVELPEVTEEQLGLECRRAARLTAMVAELEEAGVPLLAGSDSPNPGVAPGGALHDELYLLVDAGLTPVRALQVATRDAARFMGVEDTVGTIDPGKVADLVLLRADPLADIFNTRTVERVILGGRVVETGNSDAN